MPNRVIIDQSKCTKCSFCAQVCFLNDFQATSDGTISVVENAHCIKCGHCLAVCPSSAITHLDIESVPESTENHHSLTWHELMGFLSMRRSRREFRDEPIHENLIKQLLIAATQAPNALNKQQVHYSVITDRGILTKFSDMVVTWVQKQAAIVRNPIINALLRTFSKNLYKEILDLLPEVDGLIKAREEGRDAVLYNAPCVIMVHTQKASATGPEDAVYSAANILLAAEALGLGACVIGFITFPARRDRRFKQLANIQPDHIIHTTIAVGNPKFGYRRPAPKAPPKYTII